MGKTLFPEFCLLIGIKSGKGGKEGQAGLAVTVLLLYYTARGGEKKDT